MASPSDLATSTVISAMLAITMGDEASAFERLERMIDSRLGRGARPRRRTRRPQERPPCRREMPRGRTFGFGRRSRDESNSIAHEAFMRPLEGPQTFSQAGPSRGGAQCASQRKIDFCGCNLRSCASNISTRQVNRCQNRRDCHYSTSH